MINRSKCLARKLSGAILPIFIPEGLEAQNPAVVLQVLLQLLIPTAASNSDLIVFLARGSALLFLCFHREPNYLQKHAKTIGSVLVYVLDLQLLRRNG